MAKTERTKAKDPIKPLPIMERLKEFKGDILGDEYDKEYLKRIGLYEHTCLRKMRYWCFKMMHAVSEGKDLPKPPKGFIKFIEGLHGFAGWAYFARTWDIVGKNPYMVVLRLQSVWQEWDKVMERVSIPIDAPPEQINLRIQALTEEYNKSNKK